MHPAVWGVALVNVVPDELPGWLCGFVEPENGHDASVLVLGPDALYESEPHAFSAPNNTETTNRTDTARRGVMVRACSERPPSASSAPGGHPPRRRPLLSPPASISLSMLVGPTIAQADGLENASGNIAAADL
jgi:hypothetical protein